MIYVQWKYRHYRLYLKKVRKTQAKLTFDRIIIDFHAKDFCTALNIFLMQTEYFSLFSSAS